jgi:hypothetical protein
MSHAHASTLYCYDYTKGDTFDSQGIQVPGTDKKDHCCYYVMELGVGEMMINIGR